ncbi:MAG: HDIG domain-containing protein [Prevotellamassilia sp.]|nr:HDIG domain-containing protein [Prevotellamassilia sp.]
MKPKSIWQTLSRRSFLTVACTLLVSVVTLIYFLPRESKFGYVYELNKPWHYPQLIASYDFVIYKTDDEVKRERDSVVRQFVPYYRVDSLVAEKQIAALRKDFYAGKFRGIPVYYLPRLVENLRHVYARGILDVSDYEGFLKSDSHVLRLIRGQEATTGEVENFFTIRTAYDYLLNRDKGALSQESLRGCNLNDYLAVNVKNDTAKNRLELQSELSQVSDNIGMVQSGQLVIDRGQIVNAEHVRILNSLKKESEQRMDPSRGYWFIFAGQVIFVILLISLLFTYLKLFRRDYFSSPHSVLLLFSFVTVFPVITYLMMAHHFYSVYLVPYALIPIFVRIFMDSRTSFMAVVTSSLLSALSLHSPFEFVLWQIVTGATVIYSLRELTERSQLLRTVLAVVVVGLVISIGYDLSQGLNGDAFDRSRIVYMIIGGILLLFAYPLMYFVEKLFGFTSSVTLVELTNTNNPILRKMSKVAQGTFNHSMQVSNLAAEVADKIGAKAQLARTGALYHDIGKVLNPAFFTENQSGVNPHDTISEERSAQIIINHVTDGLRLAEKYHLPQVIKEFIRTHHGTGLVKYFYIQYCNKHVGEPVDEEAFRYPGPNPQTREQAVVMMCDSVEAASRSLKEYTEESITQLVNRIVDSQLAEGHFKECPITFRDIADAKRTLIDSLKTIYHTRISYPEIKKPTDQAQNSPLRGFKGTHPWHFNK